MYQQQKMKSFKNGTYNSKRAAADYVFATAPLFNNVIIIIV